MIRETTEPPIEIVPYDPVWPAMFRQEKEHLLRSAPTDLIRRIEHFGSTAVPGLAAKPIIDLLVEVTSLERAAERILPILENQGYQYFWSPNWGGDQNSRRYVWFIKRNAHGVRTHHLHMLEKCFTRCWDRLTFRDYLVAHPAMAAEYQALKLRLAALYPHRRQAYTLGKMAYIERITEEAKRFQRKETNGIS